MEEKYKKRMIQCLGFTSEDKSLKRWRQVRSPAVVLRNYLVMVLCKVLPDIELKRMLYRRIGMKIGRNVRILGSNFDIFFPEIIEIGDNSVIGSNVMIITHEFLVNEWRRGPVRIGRDVMVGAMTLILPGVEIGDGSVVAAYSLVNRNVGPGAFAGGVPVKEIKRIKNLPGKSVNAICK